MTEPSDAAKRKACELANAHMPVVCEPWVCDDVTKALEHVPLYALALYIDEVSEGLRAYFNVNMPTVAKGHLGHFVLPDSVGPLEEILGRVTAEQLRAELDKRGLTIAPKGE